MGYLSFPLIHLNKSHKINKSFPGEMALRLRACNILVENNLITTTHLMVSQSYATLASWDLASLAPKFLVLTCTYPHIDTVKNNKSRSKNNKNPKKLVTRVIGELEGRETRGSKEVQYLWRLCKDCEIWGQACLSLNSCC